jgi:DNA-binding IclR family transcriptional regulator
MAGNSTDPGRSVTSKVTAILMAFTDGGVHTLTEIADIAKLPTSTAHRLTTELLAWRLLERTEAGGYRIGLPLRIIGKDATDLDILNRAILIVRARPVIAELARTTRTNARLGALQGHTVVCLDESPQNPGGAGSGNMAHLAPALPAHATALGKALLAFSPARIVDRVIAEEPLSLTANTVTSPDNLRQALSVIRLTQLATLRHNHRDEYRAGKSAIAMPVFGGGGVVAAAIELAVRDRDKDLNAAVGALTVACRSLSRQLATEFRGKGTACCNGNGSTRSV